MNEGPEGEFGESVFADEIWAGVLSPHILLPEQWAERARQLSPENRLYLRVLQVAVDDVVGKGPANTDHTSKAECIRTARWWFEHPHTGVITLEMCCAALGLDLDAVRESMIGKIKGELPNGRNHAKARSRQAA